MKTNAQFASRIASIAILAVTACASAGCAYRTEDVSWTNADIQLAGTLYLPKSAGRHPAVIYITGSGTTQRSQRIYREHATHLSERGTAVLVYDKRGCGESDGDWKTADLSDLADDLAGGVALLRKRSDIDPDRIVLMGLSQGAWVAIITAERDPQIGGLVLLSGAPMTPAEQNQYVVEARLRNSGHDDSDIQAAVALERLIADVYRNDAGWEQAQQAVDTAGSEPWFKDARVGLQPRDFWNWQWYRKIMDYDPLPALHSLPQPILAVHGEKDPLVPAAQSIEIMQTLAPKAAGPRETALIAGARHDLRLKKGAPWPDEYWQTLDNWLARNGFMPGEAPADD